jgi:hypothetical protein
MFKAFSTVLAFLLVYMDFTGQYWITQVHAAETTSGMQGSSYGSDFSDAMNESGQFTDSTGQSVEIDPYELFGFERDESGSSEPWSSIESTYGDDAAISNMAEEQRQSAMSSPETDAQQDWANLLETTKESSPDQENDAALQTSWEMIRALDTGQTSCSTVDEEELEQVPCFKDMPAQYDSCTANRQWSTRSYERTVIAEWKFRGIWSDYSHYKITIPEFGRSANYSGYIGDNIGSDGDRQSSRNAIKRGIQRQIAAGIADENEETGNPTSESFSGISVSFSQLGWTASPDNYSTYQTEVTVVGLILENDSWRSEECLNKLDEFRSAVNDGYGVGTRVCSMEQSLKSNGCADFDGVQVCEGQLPLPGQIDDMPFNCSQVSFEGAYHGDQMPEFSGEQSCEALASDPSCSLNATDECQSYYPDGTCAFYKNEYICGYGKTDTCSTQQEVMDLFPECTTDYETQSVTDTYLFSDPKTCEVIHEKTASCNRVRDGDNSSWWTQNQYLDTYTESSDDPLNSPCQDEDDGFTSVSWTCTQRLSAFEAQYGPYEPLYPGGNGTCVKAEANYDTYFYKENNPTGPWDLNTCDVMEANSCVLTSGPSCVDGATNDIGQCYLEEYTYECGEEVQVTNTDIKREYQCGQELSCMGSDCTQATTESGMADFSEAVAMTQLMEAFSGDAQCDPENPGDCVLFSGEYMWCKKVLGGAQNCCDGPSGPSLTDYITMLRAGRKGLEALQNVEQFSSMSQPITGAWNYMKDGATSAYDAASKPVMQTWDKLSNRLFTSAPENVEAITSTAESGIQVAGEAGAGADAAASEGFIAGVKQKVANASAEFVGNTFGEGAKSAMFSGEAGNYTLGGEGAFLGNALNFIMAAYMYYAIAMMIIQVVWSCEDIEFELSAKRDLKVCKKIGSWCEVDGGIGCIEKREGFCCFSSPLSRIMNEQIRQQTGNSYGDPEGPNCEGITVDTIQSIDWSQIDLSEWIAILSTTGNMPSPDVDEMMQQYSSGAITGSSSTMANDTNRANVLERTEQRLDESSPNLIEAEMSDGLHQDVERKAQ